MEQNPSFGKLIKEHRRVLDLTQAELARRVGCATITLRKIEADSLRPSVQISERLAMMLNIPMEERPDFVRLARMALLDTPEPPPTPTPPPLPEEIGGEDLSGRAVRGYQLGERIGSGGFGVVYHATQPVINREVAVKIILPQYANHPDFIRRFETEAQLVARLEHPYIVPLYDYWREPNAAFLVMRLMRGGSLKDLIREGPLTLEFALRVLGQVGDALYTAHRNNVIHRDLKPANVLLDEDKNAYLADFGVAKYLGTPDRLEIAQNGSLLGSPAYISPEQIRSEAIMPQADIYCLGVLVYEMLTGNQPFPGPTPMDYILQHLHEALPQMGERTNALPPTLDLVLQRATAKDPLARYGDIPQFLAEIYAASDYPTAVPLAGVELDALDADMDSVEIENPYKGLRPFLEADEDDFYGRETLVQDLLGRMGEEGDLCRFLAVVGPSGSGKSSVVKAGLIPALRRGALPGSEEWFVVDFMPGAHPMEELEAALLRVAVNPPESLLGQLKEDSRGLLRSVGRVLPADQSVQLVLVVDQFEEVFTLLEDEDERVHFMESLTTAVLDPRSRLRVVITLRADFTDRPLQYVDFGDLVRMRTEFVLPLTPDELELAICGPAQRVGLALEQGLVGRIEREVGDQPGALPLLQYALTELFERREGRRMTFKGYEDSGGVLGALGRGAEAIYARFDAVTREAARQVFLRLVTLGEGVEDTRRRVARSELSSLQVGKNLGSEKQANPGVFSPVINAYGLARLLSFDRDPLTRGPTIDVAHEALLREWPRLRAWLDESREDIRAQRTLGTATKEWLVSGRDPGFLLRGARLDQFDGWVEVSELALTEDEVAFLIASLEAREARAAAESARQAREAALEQRSRRFLQALVAVFAIASIVAVGLSIFAFNAQATAQNEAEQRATAQVVAEDERAIAQQQASIARARELSQAAALNVNNDPELAILLSQQAISAWGSAAQEIPPDLEETLHKAVQNARAVHTWVVDGTALDIGFNSETNHPYLILADVKADTVRIWDPSEDKNIFSLNEAHIASEIILADLNSDGSRIAIPHEDNVARVYEIATGKLVFELQTETTFLLGTIFSPDGRLLGTFGENYVGIWDLETGELALPPYTDPTADFASFRLAFSGDGSRVVWSSPTNTFRVIDTRSGEIVAELAADFVEDISGVALSLDGNRVAASGFGDSLQVWDLTAGENQKPLNLWHNALTQYSMVFDASGDHLAFALQSGVVIWNLFRDEVYLNLSGRLDVIKHLTYNQAGDQLLTASGDGKVILWDLSPSHEMEAIPVLDQEISSGFFAGLCLDFHPDGNQIAVGEMIMLADDAPGAIRVIDISTGAQLLKLGAAEPGEYWISVAYSPDGELLASVQSNGELLIWDSSTGELLSTLSDFGEELLSFPYDRGLHGLAFSPLCDTSPGSVCPLATAGTDGQAIIWDALSGEQILKVQNEDALTAIAFNPDGKLLAFGNAQMTDLEQGGWVKLLEVESGEILQEWSGIAGLIFALGFSPDGNHLALGTTFADLRILGVVSGKQLKLDATNAVLRVEYSPDGKKLLTTTAFDNLTTVWDAETGERLYVLAEGAVFPNGLAISHDGSMVTVGMDMIYTYILDMEKLATLGQERLTRSFALDECQQYLHLEQCPQD